MGWSISDIGHTVLDAAGMVPVVGEVADGANALWYATEGDAANAALSATSMIPIAGNLATGAKWVKRGAEAADAIADTTRTADRVTDAARHADEAVDGARAAGRGAEAETLTLRGTAYRLPGWEMQPLSYTKRAPEETAALREAFDGGIRKDFLQDLGTRNADDLRAAGMTDAQVARVASGRVPQGYQVHHLKPLDDGGTNSFDNLVLIRNDPDHMLVTNHQNAVTRGMEPGDTRQVEWPMPAQPTTVWPERPGGGAVPLDGQ